MLTHKHPPNIHHHTHTHSLFFPFFQRHTSPLPDSISCITTNGLLTFPIGENPSCAVLLHPEVTLCPLNTDFLHDVLSSFSATIILSACIAAYSLASKRKRTCRKKCYCRMFFSFKRKKRAWCARRYLLNTSGKQGNGSKSNRLCCCSW